MKTVIITGGTKGIGASIAKLFLTKSYNVVIGARKREGLANQKHKNLKFKSLDVCEEQQHIDLADFALKWTGSLDCYINCAGYSQWSPIDKVDLKFLDKMIDVNLKGVFWGCKVASIKLKRGSSIINISSIAGKRGSLNNSVYCATKFGVNGITQSLAKELGNRNIRVNAVCPVYIETPGLLEALNNAESPAKTKVKEYLNEFSLSQTALGRLPLGSEVAEFCLYLASEKSSAITGQCINVDCGVLPQ